MYRDKSAIIGVDKLEMSQYNFIKSALAQKAKEYRNAAQKAETEGVSNV